MRIKMAWPYGTEGLKVSPGLPVRQDGRDVGSVVEVSEDGTEVIVEFTDTEGLYMRPLGPVSFEPK